VKLLPVVGADFITPTLLWRAFVWHVRYLLGKKTFPMSASIYVDTACNLKCPTCNYWRAPRKDTLSFDLYEKVIRDLGRMGCYYASLSGGEPFMLPDIFARLSLAKKHIPYVHAVTNGTLFNEEKVKRLAETGIDEISVSIDGLGAAHDAFRGVPGTFKRAVAGIELLRLHAPNIKVVLNSVLTPDNCDDVRGVVQLAEKWNYGIKFQAICDHPDFEGVEERPAAWQPDADKLEKIELFIEDMKAHTLVKSSDQYLDRVIPYFEHRDSTLLFPGSCNVPLHHIDIRENGRYYPCLLADDWSDETGFNLDNGLYPVWNDDEAQAKMCALADCVKCGRETMYVCYCEPRISFPITNLLRYRWFGIKEGAS
jgi:MoaA/NifB/PqqE/SkfB family radical SAM enzyme